MSHSRNLPFGQMAPSPWAEMWRRQAHGLHPDKKNQLMVSLLLRLAGGKKGGPFDVTLFGSEKARLYPHDNICEKRAFITPQYWEAKERLALKRFIQNWKGTEFVFVDAGANVGLYTLFVNAALKTKNVKSRFIAIEPEPVVRSRLAHNFCLSGIEADIFPVALAETSCQVSMLENRQNRGETCMDLTGDKSDPLSMEAMPLHKVLTKADIRHVDALKIDIEGGEYQVLRAFFQNAREQQLPRFMIVEALHAHPDGALLDLIKMNGYDIIELTKLNLILRRSG